MQSKMAKRTMSNLKSSAVGLFGQVAPGCCEWSDASGQHWVGADHMSGKIVCAFVKLCMIFNLNLVVFSVTSKNFAGCARNVSKDHAFLQATCETDSLTR